MRILFDQGTPAPLRRALSAHEVVTAHELGWSRLQNGELITAAENAGYEIFVTTDKNLKYQQKLAGRRLSIIVLMTTSWPRIRTHLAAVVAAIEEARLGGYQEVEVPRSS